jgi:hypothetical protein
MAQDAVLKAKKYFDMGYNHVVDINMAKFFDYSDIGIIETKPNKILFRCFKISLILKGLAPKSSE